MRLHITWCINNAKQETTKLSPYEILYGHPPLNAFDHAVGFDGFSIEDKVEKHVENIRQWINEAHEIVKIRLNEQHDQSAIYFNSKHHQVSFEVGDLVLLKTPPDQSDEQQTQKLTGLTTKLLFKYSGPWRIDELISPVTYRITLLPSSKRKRRLITDVVHVRRLKPYYERDSLMNDGEFPDDHLQFDINISKPFEKDRKTEETSKKTTSNFSEDAVKNRKTESDDAQSTDDELTQEEPPIRRSARLATKTT